MENHAPEKGNGIRHSVLRPDALPQVKQSLNHGELTKLYSWAKFEGLTTFAANQ